MRAVEDNKILIDLMGARCTYKFEIGPGYAMFKKDSDHPELEYLSD